MICHTICVLNIEELYIKLLTMRAAVLSAVSCFSVNLSDASICLVSCLQTRHVLEEQVELRNVAIEQLLRLAEKHATLTSCPASPAITGRG